MFIKNILKAFTDNTRIEVYTNDDCLLDYGTVGEFMDSGLMTYAIVDEEYLLTIMDNKIIIYLE